MKKDDGQAVESRGYIKAVVEALLFTADSPLTARKIAEIVGQTTEGQVRKLIGQLNEDYEQHGHSFQIKEIAGGYQMFTLPEYSEYIEKLYQTRQQSRLSQKALETLAIIAYKQPITRHEIEEIRGVNADGVLKTLLARNLITIAGRASAPGSPFIYKTTQKFLEYFGLNSLDDLPKLKEIDELISSDEETLQKYGEYILQDQSSEQLGIVENGEETSQESPGESSAGNGDST